MKLLGGAPIILLVLPMALQYYGTNLGCGTLKSAGKCLILTLLFSTIKFNPNKFIYCKDLIKNN